MTTVGDIAIVVGADISPMVREFDRAKGKITGLESAASKMGRGLGVSLAAAGAAAATAVVAVVALTKASMNNIDVMSKQARALGLSVSSFQAMAMVAGEAGVEAEQLSKSWSRCRTTLHRWAKGHRRRLISSTGLACPWPAYRGKVRMSNFGSLPKA